MKITDFNHLLNRLPTPVQTWVLQALSPTLHGAEHGADLVEAYSSAGCDGPREAEQLLEELVGAQWLRKWKFAPRDDQLFCGHGGRWSIPKWGNVGWYYKRGPKVPPGVW
jgi:hypothetical protein